MVRNSWIVVLLLSVISGNLFGQSRPEINIRYSKLYATYNFVKKLSKTYPDNVYKVKYSSSEWNQPIYNEMIGKMDQLYLHESYFFQEYPYGQKTPGMTMSLLEKLLISTTSVKEFKIRAFGIIPNADLFEFSRILEAFEPIYENLIYLPHKDAFDRKVEELNTFVKTSELETFFAEGLSFYNATWDLSIPFEIAVVPVSGTKSFSATAFLNNAVSEIPLDFQQNDILFGVLMHEIFHLLYDSQNLEIK